MHFLSSPMSRRHSRAAMLVMCARGVSAHPGAAEIMMPVRPVHGVSVDVGELPKALAVPLDVTHHGKQESRPGQHPRGLPQRSRDRS